MLANLPRREHRVLGRNGTGRFPSLRTKPLGKLNLYLFAAVEKALDRPRSRRLLVKDVEDRLYRPDHDMQRYPAILPHLDQSPVQRAQKQILSPPPDKRVFDLGIVIVVIQLFTAI